MASKVFSLAALVVVGWIIADFLTHPSASKAFYDAANQSILGSGALVTGAYAPGK